MAFDEERSRFRVWLAQAERFAETDNHIDAVARVRLIVSELDALLEQRPEDDVLQREKVFFEKQLTRFEQARDRWNQAVAARAEAFETQEKKVYRADRPGGRQG